MSPKAQPGKAINHASNQRASTIEPSIASARPSPSTDADQGSMPKVWTNFSLGVNKQTYILQESERVNVETLIELLKTPEWQSLETILHNLRVETTYVKDPAAAGNFKTKLLTVNRLGRQPLLSRDGTPALKEGKLQFTEGAKSGNAKNLTFLPKSGIPVSVEQYFHERKAILYRPLQNANCLSQNTTSN